MAEPIAPQHQQTNEGTSSTITIDRTDAHQDVPTIHLRLTKPKTDRKVQWTNETVDNEHMDKKKSKLCCIYKKQRAFGESSSSESSSDEDENAYEHQHQNQSKKKSSTPSNNPPNSNDKDIVSDTSKASKASKSTEPMDTDEADKGV